MRYAHAISFVAVAALVAGLCTSLTAKERAPATSRVVRPLIFDAARPEAAPGVVVDDATEPATGITAPVFYVTFDGETADSAQPGKVQVEERTLTLEPGKTAAPAGDADAGKAKKAKKKKKKKADVTP